MEFALIGRWKKGIPASDVFAACIFLGLGAVYVVLRYGATLVPLSAVVILLLLGAMYRDDRKGFRTSDEMRRAFEPHWNFQPFQVLALCLVVMINMFVSARALLES